MVNLPTDNPNNWPTEEEQHKEQNETEQDTRHEIVVRPPILLHPKDVAAEITTRQQSFGERGQPRVELRSGQRCGHGDGGVVAADRKPAFDAGQRLDVGKRDVVPRDCIGGWSRGSERLLPVRVHAQHGHFGFGILPLKQTKHDPRIPGPSGCWIAFLERLGKVALDVEAAGC